MFIFLLALSGFALEESLLQTAQIDPTVYSNDTQPGQTETDSVRFSQIGLRNLGSSFKIQTFDKDAKDPDYSYAGGLANASAVVEHPEKQAEYRANKGGDWKKYTSTEMWTSPQKKDGIKYSRYAAMGMWKNMKNKKNASGGLLKVKLTEDYEKKFLTTGTLDYKWKFHELTEKSYEKSVNTVASGGTAKNDDSTVSKLINNEEKVKNTADSVKTTTEDTKVYSGKGKTTLLQTKADVTTVIQTSDKGYDQLKYNDATKTTGTVGGSSRFQTGTYQNAAGGSYQSTVEKPKVTAKKSGTVDVEWRGGDSYTTSKMLNSIKKFIKRASRSESW